MKRPGWRNRLHEIIFEADTRAGRLFDLTLLIAIILSVLAVMLESVESVNDRYGEVLRVIEWAFTILFTLEYVARVIAVTNPLKYCKSFLGIIDLLSILPTYLGFIISGSHTLLVIRTIRLLRIFRILKLVHFLSEAKVISMALKASRAKITVFLLAVLSIVIIMGALMYMVETKESGFTSIPQSIYWAIVTLTTVGYGDIAPKTFLGQTIASVIMIMGYGIIAVPTGIVTTAMVGIKKTELSTQFCPNCSKEGHDSDAKYCKFCGSPL
jgi:voltage-gated potassium channel